MVSFSENRVIKDKPRDYIDCFHTKRKLYVSSIDYKKKKFAII